MLLTPWTYVYFAAALQAALLALALWRRPANRPVRDRDEILGDLIRSHASIRLNLEELRQRIASTKP